MQSIKVTFSRGSRTRGAEFLRYLADDMVSQKWKGSKSTLKLRARELSIIGRIDRLYLPCYGGHTYIHTYWSFGSVGAVSGSSSSPSTLTRFPSTLFSTSSTKLSRSAWSLQAALASVCPSPYFNGRTKLDFDLPAHQGNRISRFAPPRITSDLDALWFNSRSQFS